MRAILKIIGVCMMGVILLGMSLCVYADDDAMRSSHLWYCPKVQQLQYTEDHSWVKKPYWRSYGSSLSAKLTTFLGAEWQGTRTGEIGQLMCLYSGKDTSNFPVVMHFHSLVYLPHAIAKASSKTLAKEKVFKLWHTANSTEASGGYLVVNCKSDNPKDCPFYPRVNKPIGDIYKEAENIKENAEPLN